MTYHAKYVRGDEGDDLLDPVRGPMVAVGGIVRVDWDRGVKKWRGWNELGQEAYGESIDAAALNVLGVWLGVER